MRQLSQRKQDPEPARAHLGQPHWAPAATTPHIRPQGAPDPPGSLLGLHIHGPGYLPTQGMITRVREQNLGAFSWPATRVPGRRRALGALARSAVRRAQARLRGPRCDLLVSRVTWAHPFTLGTALANTPALGVPPAALLSPEPPRSPGTEWLHLTRAKSATRACCGSLSAALSPPPGESQQNLVAARPGRPGTRIGPGSRLKRAVSLDQYVQRGSVVESYLVETRPRGKVSPGAECARNLRGTGSPAPQRWARRQGDEERRRPLGARAGRPGLAGLRNRTALRPPAACSP